jgi:hypothetical protein
VVAATGSHGPLQLDTDCFITQRVLVDGVADLCWQAKEGRVLLVAFSAVGTIQRLRLRMRLHGSTYVFSSSFTPSSECWPWISVCAILRVEWYGSALASEREYRCGCLCSRERTSERK